MEIICYNEPKGGGRLFKWCVWVLEPVILAKDISERFAKPGNINDK